MLPNPLKTADATLLETEPGQAGLYLEQTSFLTDGQVVEFTRSTYRGDNYYLIAELKL